MIRIGVFRLLFGGPSFILSKDVFKTLVFLILLSVVYLIREHVYSFYEILSRKIF